MGYDKEYIKANSNIESFKKIMKETYAFLKDSSISRRWYDLKKKHGIIITSKQRNQKSSCYEEEYKITSNRKAFINLMKQKHTHLQESSIKRYYSRIKKILGVQKIQPIEVEIPVIKREPMYLNDNKTQLSPFKRIIWTDMVKFGYNKKYNRDQLKQHGFSSQEINWLIDNGEYKEINRYISR
jgi:hypothetical protein